MQAIKQRHPSHRFVLLTDSHCGRNDFFVSSWDVLGPTGWFDEVIFYKPCRALQHSAKAGLSLVRRLRKLSPEYVFNLSPVRNARQILRDRLFFRYMIGQAHYNGPCDRGFFTGGPKPLISGCEPEWQVLLRTAGVQESDAGFKLIVPENEKVRFQKLAKAKGVFLPEGQLLAVGPGSKMPAKRWPCEGFFELGKLLLKKFPCLHLIVLGGREDAETGKKLCSAWGERAHNFAGELSVYGSAAALERCSGFAGNDTGTMHLAAMTGVPCVALFSARDLPGKWAPYGDGHIILRHATGCAGCMLEECKEHHGRCMRLITVEQVFEAAQKILLKRYRA